MVRAGGSGETVRTRLIRVTWHLPWKGGERRVTEAQIGRPALWPAR